MMIILENKINPPFVWWVIFSKIYGMKSILIKTILTINLFFIYNCKAQTTSDYIDFYNDVAPKLNSIVPIKTQFYGQIFSTFYKALNHD